MFCQHVHSETFATRLTFHLVDWLRASRFCSETKCFPTSGSWCLRYCFSFAPMTLRMRDRIRPRLSHPASEPTRSKTLNDVERTAGIAPNIIPMIVASMAEVCPIVTFATSEVRPSSGQDAPRRSSWCHSICSHPRKHTTPSGPPSKST